MFILAITLRLCAKEAISRPGLCRSRMAQDGGLIVACKRSDCESRQTVIATPTARAVDVIRLVNISSSERRMAVIQAEPQSSDLSPPQRWTAFLGRPDALGSPSYKYGRFAHAKIG